MPKTKTQMIKTKLLIEFIELTQDPAHIVLDFSIQDAEGTKICDWGHVSLRLKDTLIIEDIEMQVAQTNNK